jgi:hypothetical protein
MTKAGGMIEHARYTNKVVGNSSIKQCKMEKSFAAVTQN